jgi:malate permease and related proteins
MQINIILNQILILSILVLIGIIGSKANVITKEAKDFLAKIIFNITLPLALLTNFSRIDVTPRILSNSLLVIGLSALVLLFMLLAGWLTTRLMKMKTSDAVIFKSHSLFGNIIFLGFPLISSLFGEEGLLYAGMFQVVSNMFIWTIGVIILNQGNNNSLKKNLLHILNPNTIAVVIGFTMFMFSVKLPPILLKPLGGLGDSNTYLSLVYMGSILYFTSFKTLFNNKITYLISFNRLLLIPAILVFLFMGINFILPVKIDPLVISVLILQAAMPCMINIVIMAKIFGADDNLATANVFISTLLSIITLPVILFLLGFIG